MSPLNRGCTIPLQMGTFIRSISPTFDAPHLRGVPQIVDAASHTGRHMVVVLDNARYHHAMGTPTPYCEDYTA
jgi:mRNA degradation ribonuclease J1/J2